MIAMKHFHQFIFIFFLFASQILFAQEVQVSSRKNANEITFVMENGMVRQSILIRNDQLLSDTLESLSHWTSQFNRSPQQLVTDANFAIRLVWNGWQAPGKSNNADNPVIFTKKDFSYHSYTILNKQPESTSLTLHFTGTTTPLALDISYQLSSGKFYVSRQIALKDSEARGHFLDRVDARKGHVKFQSAKTTQITDTTLQVLNKGQFGQPIAFRNTVAGSFMGMEYPTATNQMKHLSGNTFQADCFQYFGQKMDTAFIHSAWVVNAITPEPYVKKWFFSYADDIRVAPARPYVLYNSWYDLRSADYPRVPKDAVMNETNTLRIAHLLQKNMIAKNNIHLDAFVLDDGWDVYASDWKLRDKQFPNGLKPIADTLAKTHTKLGLWLGPTGGYSFAMKRVQWMGEHGYEVTGHKYIYGSAMMCLAGKNYSALFRKRTTDFVKNDGVGYFKWDGIQFACSEANHGHPVGIYSRRAVMQSVIDKCKAVRAIDSNVYLNITSGTWLSPWWLPYANQIWMDAADYGFADLPSISRRDNAMTYRDYALYNDFKTRNLWFPVANLMTHGIIKGRLESISKGGESIDRFTNNAVLYFARGVSMWELYISPDILTPAEWHALSQSIKWARSRFPLMKTTFMVGGNPAKGKTYGYVHFVNNKGVIAVRNPKITADSIQLKLDPEYGLNENAKDLVVEQVYPYRKILPKRYFAGQSLAIPLAAYETAIFDVFSASDSKRPLLADVIFDLNTINKNLHYKIYQVGKQARFLKPENIRNITCNGQKINPSQFKPEETQVPVIQLPRLNTSEDSRTLTLQLTQIPHSCREIALLLQNDDTIKGFPKLTFTNANDTLPTKMQRRKDKWLWAKIQFYQQVPTSIQIEIQKADWKGKAELWIKTTEKQKSSSLIVRSKKTVKELIMPPLPNPHGTFSHNVKLFTKTLK
jgi:hypothetical protein